MDPGSPSSLRRRAPCRAPCCQVYLRRCGLNEVANGGLSSYSLTLMVLAHLQEEIKVRWLVALGAPGARPGRASPGPVQAAPPANAGGAQSGRRCCVQ